MGLDCAPRFPRVEFYSQCVDVNIVAGNNAVALSSITKYSIISPPVYPNDANSGTVSYRNPFGREEQFMTGPPCAQGFNGNSCALTARGTTGFVDVGDLSPVQAPTPDPTNSGNGGGGGSAGPNPNPTLEPTVGGVCEIYEVKSGDTLSAIADSYTAQGAGYEVTWQEICSFNALENCDYVDIGDDLMIPCPDCGCFIGGVQGGEPGNGGGGGGSSAGIIAAVVIVLLLLLAGVGFAVWKGWICSGKSDLDTMKSNSVTVTEVQTA